MKSTGDGILAVFDGPGRAVRCAVAMRDGLARSGSTSASASTRARWRCEATTSAASRSTWPNESSRTPAGQVLVSRTVVDLVAGSDITFADAGDHS